MKRPAKAAVATIAIAVPLVLSAQASASTRWMFFHDRFGETCHVESG